MVCKVCGKENPDGNKFCFECGSVMDVAAAEPEVNVTEKINEAPQAPTEAPQAPTEAPQMQQNFNQPQQGAYPQYSQPQQGAYPQYSQPQGQYSQYGQPQQYGYQQSYGGAAQTPEYKSAKSLGTASIILGFLIPLACWICGGIGLSKANALIANFPGDPDASKVKSHCVIGIVIGIVMFLITFCCYYF